MAEDSFTGKERGLSRTLVPGTNTIPQILPPPQRIGASSLNQVHRQHCNINDFSETHRTRRCSCNNQWVQRPTCKLPTHSNHATGVPHLQLLRLTSCCGGIHLEHLDREAVWELFNHFFCCNPPLQAPGCEQQAGKAVWSTMHSSPRHSRPLAC